MDEFLLCVISLCFLFFLSKQDHLNPAAVYCTIAFANAWVFYLCGIHGYGISRTQNWWEFKEDFSPAATQVLSFALVQCVMAIVAFVIAKKNAKPDVLHTILGREAYRSFLARKLDQTLQSGPVSAVTFGLLIVVSGLCIVQLTAVKPGVIWEYSGYLLIKAPEGAGITNPVLGSFHRVLPYVGILLGPLLVYSWARSHWLLLSFAVAPALYAYMYALSLASREAVAILLAMSMAFFATGKENRGKALLMLSGALWTYQGVILTRVHAGTYGTYGLAAVFSVMFSPRVFAPEELFFMIFNIFGGDCNFGHAILHAPLDYPLSFKLKSFFPGPSFIDGFQTLRQEAERKIQWNVPYGAYSETYLFGIGWFAGFLLFLSAVLIGLCRFWEKFRGIVAVIVLCLSYLSFVSLYSYPIRNSFRFILLSCVLAYTVSRLLSRGRQS